MRVVGVSGMRLCGAVLDARCPAPGSLALLAARFSAPSPLAPLAVWSSADGSLAPLAVRCSAPKVVAQRSLSRSTVLSTPLALPSMGLGQTALLPRYCCATFLLCEFLAEPRGDTAAVYFGSSPHCAQWGVPANAIGIPCFFWSKTATWDKFESELERPKVVKT